MARGALILLLAFGGCAREPLSAGSTSTSASTSGSGTGASTSSSSTAGPTSTTSSATSSTTSGPTTEDTGSDTGCLFIPCTDVNSSDFECDQWAQDCPRGMKCVPASINGPYDGTRCVLVEEDAGALYEPCTVIDAGAGQDSCDVGLLCWEVDPQTGLGTCIGLCTGTEQNPSCEDPCARCKIYANGALTVCRRPCDPRVQDCGDGYGCHTDGNGAFTCEITGAQPYGEPCEFTNDCAPGLACLTDAVPNCAGNACCSPYCDLGDDPAQACPDFGPNQTCVAWFGGIGTPEKYGSLGACMAPI